MSTWFYEPFYDFDRFFDELSYPLQLQRGTGNQLQRTENNAVRSLKPKYA